MARSSNSPPDIGHLFKRDAPKRGRRSSPSEKHRGEHRIQRVLNALQDHGAAIGWLFSDQTHHAKPLANRCNKRRGQTMHIETIQYTYEIVNGTATYIRC
jgi:hypothetical protein